jgi:uncharacterized protein (DUF2252 family)
LEHFLVQGYLGPFTWDVKRLVASINIIGFSKAYSDKKIANIIRALVRAYLAQIDEFCRAPDSPFMAITSENTTGPVNKLLKEARLGSKEAHLNTITVVENYERKFIRSSSTKNVDDQLRHEILFAFQEYLQTIPESKKQDASAYQVMSLRDRHWSLFIVSLGERYRFPNIDGNRFCWPSIVQSPPARQNSSIGKRCDHLHETSLTIRRGKCLG